MSCDLKLFPFCCLKYLHSLLTNAPKSKKVKKQRQEQFI